MAKRRMGIIAFVLCFCMCLMPCRVLAASTTDAKEPISTDKKCSLTLSYCCEETAFSALPVKLYKIAEVSSDCQYTLTPSFEKCNLILNGIQSTSEWNVIRSTLETYILANELQADFTDITGQDGTLSFEELNTGLYLAIAGCVIQNNITYIFDSALVALPGLDTDGVWQYQVAVSAKCEIVPSSDDHGEIELKVIKLWKGDNGKTDRPRSVEVEIFRNGASYAEAILSEDNNWTYSWTAKDDGSEWKVVERNIPSEYTMTIEERKTTFVLTNTLTSDVPDTPTTPQTGDTSNIMLYVILMVVSGGILIILGITGKRKRV